MGQSERKVFESSEWTVNRVARELPFRFARQNFVTAYADYCSPGFCITLPGLDRRRLHSFQAGGVVVSQAHPILRPRRAVGVAPGAWRRRPHGAGLLGLATECHHSVAMRCRCHLLPVKVSQ
jgi:hypothetical protein